ncbi:unnamed protein product, partial [Acanthoscelides obtectus]
QASRHHVTANLLDLVFGAFGTRCNRIERLYLVECIVDVYICSLLFDHFDVVDGL